jgi:SP family sugar:H+ symporter-like MFS transporter
MELLVKGIAVVEQTSSAQADDNLVLITLISVVATIGGFLFGFDSGVINGTVDGLQTAFSSDSIGTGFNVASMLLGCAVGAYFAGRLADLYGRRTLLIVAAAFFIISAWGSGIAAGSTEFVIYRILGGLAVGAASVMSPAYISEIAPTRLRGRLMTIQQIAIITGLFIAFVSNYLLAKSAGLSTAVWWLGFEAWRWMFWMELVPAVIFLLALLVIPESPRYLMLTQKVVQARAVLARLFGQSRADELVQEIDESLAVDHHRPKFTDLRQPSTGKGTGKIRKIVWVGIGLATFQQLVGINVVFYYGAVLWQAVGFSESDALMINIISGATSIVACTVTILFIDKVGRKPFLWVGSVGMAIALVLVTVAFSTGTMDPSGNLALSDAMGLLALIAANVYVMFFNGTWGPVMWVMLGEMFPNQMRGYGLAVAGLAQWGANFVVTISFPILLATIGLAVAYGIYAFFAALSVWFVLRMVHETRGIALEDMEG